MAIFGKNGLWAATIYVASLLAVYNREKVTYKDDKEIDGEDIIAFRKSLKGQSKTQKEAMLKAYRTKAFTSKAAGQDLSPEFKKAYTEAKWAR